MPIPSRKNGSLRRTHQRLGRKSLQNGKGVVGVEHDNLSQRIGYQRSLRYHGNRSELAAKFSKLRINKRSQLRSRFEPRREIMS
jgi:hypothetical protein